MNIDINARIEQKKRDIRRQISALYDELEKYNDIDVSIPFDEFDKLYSKENVLAEFRKSHAERLKKKEKATKKKKL